ncbi:uncharacterized protein [Blastocystis hominis]|uniref:Methyltransferase n=1 Tax=Blastocystis hominis TaxID=12968 RepID=D8M049_BLAHO|nr:Methyltransferase [Blastocystis hominis]XP_012898054.1 uncharacterized protein [Blastocystis hominis]CBK21438.2 Methyltransferase [Blastocystis hominis]CBK24006.2 unnamed protein product [Blastocystis hominis]|eukprot:XP_012895486.1 Methyltransferase [Blastocystis hominis]
MFVLRSLSQKTAPFAVNGLKTMLRRTTPAMQQIAPVVYTKEQRPVPEDYRVPDYMEKIYTWCYVKPKNVKMLDRQLVVQAILFGYFQPLANMVCEELKPGQKLLQCGSTYGKLVATVSKKLGPTGTYNCCDIMPIQVASCNRKMSQYPCNGGCILEDAATHHPEEDKAYDAALSFLLLHEVPDDTKYKVINRIMMSVPVGGKAIFIEYHKPAWYSPWRYMMPIVYWLLEPLAFPVWHHQITELGDPELVKKFKWRKELRFMGLYQKLVGVRVED